MVNEMRDRIKELRQRLELTQKEFGNAIGVGTSAVSYLEAGKSKLTESNLMLICERWNVNKEWLLYGSGDMFLPQRDDYIEALRRRYGLSDLETQILSAYLALSAESRHALMETISEMAAHISGSGVAAPVPDADPVAAAEAAYEKALGIAPSTDASASSTTGGTGGSGNFEDTG